MNKLLFACIAFIVASGTMLAESYKYELNPYVGYNWAGDDCPLDDSVGGGLNFNTFFTNNLGLRFGYERLIKAEVKSNTKETDVNRFYLNGIYKKAEAIKGFTPYAVAGGGYEVFEDDVGKNCKSGWFADIGAGLSYSLSEHVSIGPEVKALKKNCGNAIDIFAGLGLGYKFGYDTPVVVPDPKVIRSKPEVKIVEKVVIKEVPVEKIVTKEIRVPVCPTPVTYTDRCDNSYYVQVAAALVCPTCIDKYDNKTFLNKLKDAGYGYSLLTTKNFSGNNVTRVLVGPYQCKKDAFKALCEIKGQMGCDAFIYSTKKSPKRIWK